MEGTKQDSQKYVAVVFDEVKIKEDIVNDKNECVIIGFTDLVTGACSQSGSYSDRGLLCEVYQSSVRRIELVLHACVKGMSE